MIEIKPDPKHPRGGFAEVNIEGASAASDPVTLSVFNSYQQKWLGPNGWQPNNAELVARSARQDGDTLRLIVGPEMVNNIEEDTPIRIEVAGSSWDTYWPDSINVGPDEAVVGDIGGMGITPEAKAPTTVIAQLEEEVTDTSEAEIEEVEEDPVEVDGPVPITPGEPDEPGKKSALPLALAGLAAVAVIAALAYFALLQPDTEVAGTPDPDPIPVIETAAPALPNPCSAAALSDAEGQGFNALADKMRGCGDEMAADDALRFVEQAAAANDPDALALFGALYDEAVTDEAIENSIGLTFSDQAPRAAEYYARAVAAGSADAKERLLAVCRRLLLQTGTLSRSAREDYCQ